MLCHCRRSLKNSEGLFHQRAWEQSTKWNPGICLTTICLTIQSLKEIWWVCTDRQSKGKFQLIVYLQLLALRDNISLAFILDDPGVIKVIQPQNWEDTVLLDCLQRKRHFQCLLLSRVLTLHFWVPYGRVGVRGLETPYLCLSFLLRSPTIYNREDSFGVFYPQEAASSFLSSLSPLSSYSQMAFPFHPSPQSCTDLISKALNGMLPLG